MKKLMLIISAVLLPVLLLCPFSVAADNRATSFSYTYNYKDESQAVPAPYTSEKPISGAESFGGMPLNAPTDFFVAGDELYILDSGNSRIAVLDKSFAFLRNITLVKGSSAVELGGAAGIFVRNNGDIYIADKIQKTVYISDKNGNVKSEISAPPADKVEPDFEYAPTHVLVDRAGVAYVISANTYSGALQYNEKGEFIGFFGSGEVEVNIKVLINRLWKRILSEEAAAGLQRSVPTSFVQFDIDNDNFVYTVRGGTGLGTGQIRKINPNSVNVLLDEDGAQAAFGDLETYFDSNANLTVSTTFSDITVDNEGYMTLIDTTRNRLFQYDQNTQLLYTFGGAGNQNGTFKAPVAVESMGEKILVLDSGLGGIHVFNPTQFADSVRAALSLYDDGKYEDAEVHWRKILSMDSYYEPANIGMGKIYERMGDYDTAMSYYKLGHSKSHYSDSFAQKRDAFLRKNFAFILAGVVLALLGLVAYIYITERRIVDEYSLKISKRGFPIYCLKSPFKGYLEMNETKSASGAAAAIILAVFFLVNVISTQLTSFHFNPNASEPFNIFLCLAQTIGIYILFVVCNWAISTLADGKGKFSEICIFTAYSLQPLIITTAILIIASNVFSLEEQAFYTIISVVGIMLTALHLFISQRDVHEYTLSRTLLVLIGSIFGMYLLILIITVAYSMFVQLLSFISMIYSELRL